MNKTQRTKGLIMRRALMRAICAEQIEITRRKVYFCEDKREKWEKARHTERKMYNRRKKTAAAGESRERTREPPRARHAFNFKWGKHSPIDFMQIPPIGASFTAPLGTSNTFMDNQPRNQPHERFSSHTHTHTARDKKKLCRARGV